MTHGAVRATVQYMLPQAGLPVCHMEPRGDGGPQQTCCYEAMPVEIGDARRRAPPATLHVEGFELLHAPTAVRDLTDDEAVRGTYYAELRELALAVTGASEAIVFDHQLRRREEDRRALTFGRHGGHLPVGPVGRVHNDYTEASGHRRLHLVLGDRAARVDGRYGIVNLWRPLAVVQDTPLAVCEAGSVAAADLVETELRYPQRVGWAYQLLHRPSHRWWYFPLMAPAEVLAFKQFDSAAGVARFTPHSAFELPDVPPGAPLRTSIEARVLVLY